jgi:hypothetical protein
MENILETLHLINVSLLDARQHLAEVESVMAAIEAAGMYPAVPTEAWKNDSYLYMRFADRVNGLELDAKNRLYIGTKADKIIEARRLAENRRRWEQLNSARRSLQGWLAQREDDIKQLRRAASTWKKVGDLEALGPAGDQVLATESPKAV